MSTDALPAGIQEVTSAYVQERVKDLLPHMWAAELDRLQEHIFSNADPEDYVVYPATFQAVGDDYVLFWSVAVPKWSTSREERGYNCSAVLDCFRHAREDVTRDMAAALNMGRRYRRIAKK